MAPFKKISASETRIVVPFMPSLFHISLVKIAVCLYSDFDIETWKIILKEIQPENPLELNKYTHDIHEVNKAREKILFIPAHLRIKVLEAIMGLYATISRWRVDHSVVQNFPYIDITFYWRPDGTIDRIKTIKQLVRNRDICIRLRFDLACSYFLKKRIKSLWKKLIKAAKTDNVLTGFNRVSYFWVRWMVSGTRVPWNEAVGELLDMRSFRFPIPRFSAFLPFLQPEVRQKYFSLLHQTTCDDLQFCLYGVTKEEEKQILKTSMRRFLELYLEWPLQSFFLEMVDKLWNFIDYSAFDVALNTIYFYSQVKYDYDYYKLYMDFWNRSPDHYKEQTRADPIICSRIDLCINVLRKRKADCDEQKNSKKKKSRTDKKWIRKNGRLQPIL